MKVPIFLSVATAVLLGIASSGCNSKRNAMNANNPRVYSDSIRKKAYITDSTTEKLVQFYAASQIQLKAYIDRDTGFVQNGEIVLIEANTYEITIDAFEEGAYFRREGKDMVISYDLQGLRLQYEPTSDSGKYELKTREVQTSTDTRTVTDGWFKGIKTTMEVVSTDNRSLIAVIRSKPKDPEKFHASGMKVGNKESKDSGSTSTGNNDKDFLKNLNQGNSSGSSGQSNTSNSGGSNSGGKGISDKKFK